MMKGKQASLLMWAMIATLLSQCLVIPVCSTANFQDQKNFFHFPPTPFTGHIPPITSTPPIVTSPPTGHIPPISSTPPIVTSPPAGSVTPSPPHGSSGGSHGSTPSHGDAPPAANCPNPPKGGGHHSPSPSPPKSGSSGGHNHHNHQHSPPTTPKTPSTPSTPKTPSTPSTPKTPSTPSTPKTPSTPSTPSTPTHTPSTPSTPSTPGLVPPPFDPKTPITGTCDFWKSHPQYVAAIFGWWGNLGKAFGVTSLPGFGPHASILDLLSNNHKDGFGSLCREGTASLLNSMVNNKFPYSTKQVRDHFAASLSSENAAANQANLFKLANQGRFKLRA